MRVKNQRVLKNGTVAGYVYYNKEKKWKWRFIGKKAMKKLKGGVNVDTFDHDIWEILQQTIFISDDYITELATYITENTNMIECLNRNLNGNFANKIMRVLPEGEAKELIREGSIDECIIDNQKKLLAKLRSIIRNN